VTAVLPPGVRAVAQPGNRSHWECTACLASPGAPCRYTVRAFSRDEATGSYVFKEAGTPMLKMHVSRPKIRCVPLVVALV
jgi:hypothetical protein